MDSEETNKRFNSELQMQIDGTLPKGHIYGLGYPEGNLLSAGLPNLPIELNAMRLTEKASENYRHPFNIAELKNLPKAINDPIAVFSYGDKTKAVNVITEIKAESKNILVGIALNPEINGKKLNINSIRTIFPKDFSEWENWISQGKALYLNEGKMEAARQPQTPRGRGNSLHP
jgi:hypothetical protein